MRKYYFLVLIAIVFTMNAVAQNIPNYVPKDGLLGYWPFNGNANDESGNGNHGTVSGVTLTMDRNGVANSAYSFEGMSNYINIGNSSNLKRYNTNFSISSWIKPNEFSKLYDQAILSNRTSNNCGSKLSIGGEWNQIKGQLVYVINGGNTSELVKSTINLDTSKYEYVCITNIYENNVNIVKLFINGIKIMTDTIFENMCDPGIANTNDIMSKCKDQNSAVSMCYNLVSGGKTDWYLPNIQELRLVYNNMHLQNLGNFNQVYYWSSDSYYTNNAYLFGMNSGDEQNYDTQFTGSVRAIRRY